MRIPSSLLLFTIGIGLPAAAAANGLDRDREPVVLAGSALPDLQGADPARIVAFRYEAGWIQFPVQVDERALVDFGTVYDSTAMGYTLVTYADTSTFTGADPDPFFDGDDELVFMARHAGAAAAVAAEPAATVPGTGVEVTLTHPTTGTKAYAYLFESDGTLVPGAGDTLVHYDFHLLSGSYKDTYNTTAGPNPEDSRVTAPGYSVHFADRWIRDETALLEGGATGVDILDRHKSQFAPGNCGRTEDTFSAGEGAFLVNKEGPVRALRGYVGANSGPTTYRMHAFYERREEVRTVLRVHAISGIVDYFDYSPAAVGMTWHDDLNAAGVPVDGSPDAVTPGEFRWQMVTGVQGTLAIGFRVLTDIPAFDYTTFYSDDASPATTQCTGDGSEYAASGFWETDPIPNTDPALGAYNIFEVNRVLTYGPPQQGIGFAEAAESTLTHPLDVTAASYVPSTVSVGEEGRASGGPLALRISPNPARRHAALHFVQPVAGPFRVDLIDVAGRRVGARRDAHRAAGEHRLDLSLADLAAGVYFVRATGADGEAEVRRLVRLP